MRPFNNAAFKLTLPEETFNKLQDYCEQLTSGNMTPGIRLSQLLKNHGIDLSSLTTSVLFNALLNTKQIQIMPESVGTTQKPDWNDMEGAILCDTVMTMEAKAFSNGGRARGRQALPSLSEAQPGSEGGGAPATDETTPATLNTFLIAVSGPLLAANTNINADKRECGLVRINEREHAYSQNGVEFDEAAYTALLNRRFAMAFAQANAFAANKGEKIVVTLSGLGLGCFLPHTSVKTQLQMNELFESTLNEFLNTQKSRLSSINAVMFDPYDGFMSTDRATAQEKNKTRLIGHLTYVCASSHPNCQSQNSMPQIYPLNTWMNKDFKDCLHATIINADGYAVLGNEGLYGALSSDEPCKVFSTNALSRLTGCDGNYSYHYSRYLYSKVGDLSDWNKVLESSDLPFGFDVSEVMICNPTLCELTEHKLSPANSTPQSVGGGGSKEAERQLAELPEQLPPMSSYQFSLLGATATEAPGAHQNLHRLGGKPVGNNEGGTSCKCTIM